MAATGTRRWRALKVLALGCVVAVGCGGQGGPTGGGGTQGEPPLSASPPDDRGDVVRPSPPSGGVEEARGDGSRPPAPQQAPPPTPPPAPPPPPAERGFPPLPAHFTYPPLQEAVEEYGILIAPELLALFYEDEETPEQPAVFVHPDGRREDILIRLRGNSSRSWPKKSWRIEFPKGQGLDGRRKLNLVSEWREQTLMLEKLGYDMLAAMGVPAARATYVRLSINGTPQGVYLDLERIDKAFMKRAGFQDPDSTIYRCGGKNCEMKTSYDKAYQRDWEKETNLLGSDAPRDDFLRAINYTPEPELVSMLEERFELEHYLRSLAMEALISNSTVEDSKSYVLHDAVTGRWSYAVWDLNNTDAKYTPDGRGDVADFQHPLFSFSVLDGYVEAEYLRRSGGEPGRWRPIFSNLNTRLAFHPELRARWMARVDQALKELFTPAVLHPRIDAIFALISPHQKDDPHAVLEKFNDGPRYLKQYSANRARFLKAQLAAYRAQKPSLVLQAVDARAGWVELRNLGSAAMDTTGLVLTTDLRRADVRNVPSLTLAPGQTVRLSASELGLTLAAEGEVGLFDGTRPLGVIDLLFYGRLSAGQHHARSEREPARWEVR